VNGGQQIGPPVSGTGLGAAVDGGRRNGREADFTSASM
jgi:hypothetical protein